MVRRQTPAPTRDLTERASRLRLAITRTARRMRQEAGSELGPASLSALATIERAGPLTPSELAEAERIQRPTATRILARLAEDGLVTRDRRSRPTAAARSSPPPPRGARCCSRLRKRKNAYLARRMKELPDDDVAALERAAEILERVLEEERRLSAALRKSFASLSVPNYRLYFGGQVVSLAGNWMQIVAELWLILALTGSGVAVGHRHRPAVHAGSSSSAPSAARSPTASTSASS